MEFALGVLGWSPSEFWSSTPLELTSAYVGYCRREGIGKWQPDPAGYNFETAEAALAEKRRMEGQGEPSSLRDMSREDRIAYKQQRRGLRETGRLGGRYTN
jgi:hypothetical protein